MYRFLACTAEQYMTHSVVIVTRQANMRDLEELFNKYDFNSFPVVKEEKLVGVVTKLDFLRTFVFATGEIVPHYDELMRRTVADVMSTSIEHVEPETPLTRVLETMVRLKVHSLPVISERQHLLGMISRTDVIRALKDATCMH